MTPGACGLQGFQAHFANDVGRLPIVSWGQES